MTYGWLVYGESEVVLEITKLEFGSRCLQVTGRSEHAATRPETTTHGVAVIDNDGWEVGLFPFVSTTWPPIFDGHYHVVQDMQLGPDVSQDQALEPPRQWPQFVDAES